MSQCGGFFSDYCCCDECRSESVQLPSKEEMGSVQKSDEDLDREICDRMRAVKAVDDDAISDIELVGKYRTVSALEYRRMKKQINAMYRSLRASQRRQAVMSFCEMLSTYGTYVNTLYMVEKVLRADKRAASVARAWKRNAESIVRDIAVLCEDVESQIVFANRSLEDALDGRR